MTMTLCIPGVFALFSIEHSSFTIGVVLVARIGGIGEGARFMSTREKL
jgi:hypothetical protein